MGDTEGCKLGEGMEWSNRLKMTGTQTHVTDKQQQE